MNSKKSKAKPPPQRSGRPTAYTEALGDAILDKAKLGIALALCADAAGVPRWLAQSWLTSGEDRNVQMPEPRLVNFAQRYRKAHAMLAVKVHADIMTSDDVRAKQKLLETVHADVYGPQVQRVELTGKDGGAIKTEGTVRLEDLTTGELRKRLAALTGE